MAENLPERALAGVLILQAGQYTMDAWSTLNSSPWTGENVGADPEKLDSLKRYCTHAAIVSTGYCTGAGLLAKSWWPIIGSLINNAYLIWIYKTAVDRAKIAATEGKPNTWGMGNAQVNTSSGSY